MASSAGRGPRTFGLGRGLDALIPAARDERGVLDLPLDRVERNPNQPRSTFDETQLGQRIRKGVQSRHPLGACRCRALHQPLQKQRHGRS